MAYSVLTEPWLQVRMADGSIRRVAPWQIADPSVVDISLPRPDMTGAARELVIGLLQALYPPADDEEKLDRIMAPPAVDDMRRIFETRADLFELVEGQSRFLQDHGGVTTDDVRPIDSLLMNGPGENTRKLQKDFFVRRDVVASACPHCVVLMLAARQFYASGSGAGFRVSPRGGGPLTTIIEFVDDAGKEVPLWHSLYANVIPLSVFGGEGLTDANAPRVLPWLAPLRVSKSGKSEVLTTLEHADPLQVYFPAANRAEMVWQEHEAPCPCDVCGEASRLTAVSWKTGQYGVKYTGLLHPLTPYRQDKDSGFISMKPKLSGISYLDWMAITFGSEGKDVPALNIRDMKDSISALCSALNFTPRIRAYGYQLDNASALAWHEATVPFVDVPEHLRRDFAINVTRFVETARQVASLLENQILLALYGKPDARAAGGYKLVSVSGDHSHIRRELISATAPAFYDNLPAIVSALETDGLDEIKRAWLKTLQRQSLALFERHAPVHVTDERNLERLVRMHRRFSGIIRSSWAATLLNLPVPQKVRESSPPVRG